MIPGIPINIRRYYSILFPDLVDFTTAEGRSADRYRGAAWTSITNAVAQGVFIITGLISVPLTIHYLGEERFGLWMAITAAVSMVQLADFGIGNGLLNKISEAKGRDDNESIRSLISNSLAVSLLIAGSIMALFFITGRFVSWPAVFNAKSPATIAEAGPTTAVLAMIFALNIVFGMVIKINIALQRGYVNGMWQIAGNITGLAALIIAMKMEAGLPVLVASYMAGPLAATIANALFLFSFTHSWARPSITSFDFTVVRSLIGIGFWFLIFQIVVTLNSAAPALVVSHILGLHHVAVFAVSLKLVSVAVMVQTLILSPLWPAYAEAKTRGDLQWIETTFVRSLGISGVIGLGASAFIVSFGGEIIRVWVDDGAVPPAGVLWGLGTGVFLSSLYGPLTMFLNGIGKIKIQALYGLAFTAFMIASCIFLTGIFHLSGSAWAYGVAYTLPSVAVSGFITYRVITDKRERALS